MICFETIDHVLGGPIVNATDPRTYAICSK